MHPWLGWLQAQGKADARDKRSGLGKPTQRQLTLTSTRNNRLQHAQIKTENCFSVFERDLSLCGYAYVQDSAGDAVAAAATALTAVGQRPMKC